MAFKTERIKKINLKSGLHQICSSPYILQSAMGMLLSGSKNTTAKQIWKKIIFPDLGKAVQEGLNSILNRLTTGHRSFMKANLLYVMMDTTCDKTSMNNTKNGYLTTSSEFNFVNEKPQERKSMDG